MGRSFVLVMLMAGLLPGACGLGNTNVRGSGNVTSESREVSGFDEVVLSGSGNLTVRQTGSESLTIEAEDNIIPNLETGVESNRLVIGAGDGVNVRPTKPINYELTVKDLSALDLRGSGNIDVENVSTDTLEVTSAGSGNIDLRGINVGSLKITNRGSATVSAAGRADSQDVTISGSGSYQAEDLESKEAKISAKGAGAATVKVSDKLDVETRGSGSVEYIGDPTVSQDVRGSGRVRQRQ